MSTTAQELITIALTLGKFRADELQLAIAEVNVGDGPLTVATVTKALQNLSDREMALGA